MNNQNRNGLHSKGRSKMQRNRLKTVVAALIATYVTCSSWGSELPAKTGKTPENLYQLFMSRVTNKSAYDHQKVLDGRQRFAMKDSRGLSQVAAQSALETPADSTEPVDKNILARMKISEEITPETTDLLGEQIDMNSGSVSFKHTDVSIPGNSPLDVAIHRSFRGVGSWMQEMGEFSDWNLDIPHISTTLLEFRGHISSSWGQGFACSGNLSPDSSWDSTNGIIFAYQYWNGDTLNVPGHVNDKLLLPGTNLTTELGGNTNQIRRVTRSNWRLACTDKQSKGYEGFTAYAPDGSIYTFDEFRMRYQGTYGDSKYSAMRYQAFMLVSRIEDRFGNWVEYEYDDHSRLTRIHSNDLREITLDYGASTNNFEVLKVTANGREWHYEYAGTESTTRQLKKVTRPDNTYWQYDLGNIGKKKPISLQNGDCKFTNADPNTYASSITHPNGVTGTFYTKETLHGVANIDREQAFVATPESLVQAIPKCNAHMSLVKKELTGPGLDKMTWQYDYTGNKGFFSRDKANNAIINDMRIASTITIPEGLNDYEYKATTVTAPDGSVTRHFYNRDWSSALDGMVEAVMQYDTDGTTLLNTTRSTYRQAQKVGSTSMDKTNTLPLEYRVNKTSEVITQHNIDGDTTYTTEYLEHNSLGNVVKEKQFNDAFNRFRYMQYGYENHVEENYYVLQLPTYTSLSEDNVGYTATQNTSYYPWNHQYHSLPRQEKQFGNLIKENVEYHTDGNLAKVEYNVATNVTGQKRYQQFGNYHRGQPQLFTLPARSGAGTIQASQTVDNNGWVTSTSDFNGNCTNYQYDTLGRLSLVDPCDGYWTDTSISFGLVAGAEEPGIESGMYKQTLSRGNFQKTNYLDALFRPVLSKTEDTSIPGSAVYQKSGFNPYNKATFKAYPAGFAGNTNGITTSYDGAQREVRIAQTGVATDRIYSYLAGNKRKETNNRGYSTTTTYQAYGKPEFETATYIDAPEGVTTDIQLNLFGNITSISQGGLTEYRYYDTSQRMCQSYRADIGKRVLQYNAIGEMLWYAEGASGHINGCSTADVIDNEKVNLSYDNHGQLILKDYLDDSTSDISYGYDNNGNQISVNSSNSAHWNYLYNSQNQLQQETLSMDGQQFAFQYQFNPLGHLDSLTYPSGRQVSYSPNAMGQPTQAGAFAINAQYHANGMLAAFEMANSTSYRLDLNERQLPSKITTLKNHILLSDLSYAYDGNGNLMSLTDGMDSSYNVSMDYDGLDRLTLANGKWGNNTAISYDTMGNITAKQMGDLNVYYNYNAITKRLDSASVTGAENKSFGFSYDSKGAVISNSQFTLPRNQAGQVTGAKDHSFVYDGNGKRVIDEKEGDKRYSIYNQSGKMLYQWDQATETVTDYIFLNNILISEAQVALGDGSENKDNTNVGYTGHQLDSDLGLNYMQARYYDPALGRFYSNDQIGFRDVHSFNRYAYTNNNPYRYVDPDGMAPSDAQLQQERKELARNITTAGAALKITSTYVGYKNLDMFLHYQRHINKAVPGTFSYSVAPKSLAMTSSFSLSGTLNVAGKALGAGGVILNAAAYFAEGELAPSGPETLTKTSLGVASLFGCIPCAIALGADGILDASGIVQGGLVKGLEGQSKKIGSAIYKMTPQGQADNEATKTYKISGNSSSASGQLGHGWSQM